MNIYDFGDGNGPVAAHQHPNGGGWVADTATVDASVYVGTAAHVYGNAEVYGDAWVYSDARVYGNARVYGIMRSDGYAFVALPCADGQIRVIAGCRYFTFEEAREHWKHRAGTFLGDETDLILDFLEKSVALKGYGG
tara:strand:- start:1111 stop:1521 length:411 start_codon:yes stop_codon:yes gene_type:complete